MKGGVWRKSKLSLLGSVFKELWPVADEVLYVMDGRIVPLRGGGSRDQILSCARYGNSRLLCLGYGGGAASAVRRASMVWSAVRSAVSMVRLARRR